jgi:hypothetical protein
MYHKTSASTADRKVKPYLSTTTLVTNRRKNTKSLNNAGYGQEWRSIGNFKSEVMC